MPGTTSPDNIVYPLPTDPIAPLNAVFQDMAESVQDALDAIDLDKLADVDVPSPSIGDLLQFDGADWVNADVNSVLGAGKILQVVSTAKTDAFTTTSTSFTDITGLSVAITPSSTSSKILVIPSLVFMGDNGATLGYARLMRDSTPIFVGDTAGSRIPATFTNDPLSQSLITPASATFLDSPSTVSAITYKLQMRVGSGGTAFVNRLELDTDNNLTPRFASSITVMEVAG